MQKRDEVCDPPSVELSGYCKYKESSYCKYNIIVKNK